MVDPVRAEVVSGVESLELSEIGLVVRCLSGRGLPERAGELEIRETETPDARRDGHLLALDQSSDKP
jgi:hypothetical protein